MKSMYGLSLLLLLLITALLMAEPFNTAGAASQGYPVKICYHDKVPFERITTSESRELMHIVIFENISLVTPPRQHPDGDPADCRIHHDVIFN